MEEKVPPQQQENASSEASWRFDGEAVAAAITSLEELLGGDPELGCAVPLCPGAKPGEECCCTDFPPLLDVPDSTSLSAVKEEAATATAGDGPPPDPAPSASCHAAASTVSSDEPPLGSDGTAADTGCKKRTKRSRQPRLAFMTKSEIDHLEDGYRWRKYGQKTVKNSSFPRSYYRCTSSNCAVKKRVERSPEDPSIVITTYEGQHSHHTVSSDNTDFPRCSVVTGSAQLYNIAEAAALPDYRQRPPPPPTTTLIQQALSDPPRSPSSSLYLNPRPSVLRAFPRYSFLLRPPQDISSPAAASPQNQVQSLQHEDQRHAKQKTVAPSAPCLPAADEGLLADVVRRKSQEDTLHKNNLM